MLMTDLNLNLACIEDLVIIKNLQFGIFQLLSNNFSLQPLSTNLSYELLSSDIRLELLPRNMDLQLLSTDLSLELKLQAVGCSLGNFWYKLGPWEHPFPDLKV
jgi:hypothetical protein